MTQSCPISFQRIDSNMVRLIAIQVIIVGILLIWTNHIFFSFLLLFDFSVRTLRLNYMSPFTNIAKLFIKAFNIEEKLCNEAPKRFALYLGLGIIGFFTLLLLFSLIKLASAIVGLLLLCAFLEATFDYCIGCKIYQYLQIIIPNK